TVTGTVSDALSGVASITCNGEAQLSVGSGFTCLAAVSLADGSIVVEARDRAANVGSARVAVSLRPIPIGVTITSPAPLALFRTGPVVVTGVLDRAATSVVVNGVQAELSGLSFTASGVTLREGNNVLTATATAP